NAAGPVVGDALDLRRGRLEGQLHVREAALDLRVIGHRAAEGQRRLLLDAGRGQVARTLSQAQIDAGEGRLRPSEDRQHEEIGGAGRQLPGDVAIRHEGAVENRVVTPGRAHAERVPRLLDRVALGLTRQERVDDLRSFGIGRVHRVNPEARPYGRKAAEDL